MCKQYSVNNKRKQETRMHFSETMSSRKHNRTVSRLFPVTIVRLGHESRATTRTRADTHDAEIAGVVYRTRGFP